jgi:hypothetical protein
VSKIVIDENKTVHVKAVPIYIGMTDVRQYEV